MMNTQIVYVVVSSDKDVFLEELWVSVWSLRQYHNDAVVKVLVDKLTGERIERHPIRSLINDIVVVPTPDDYTPMQRSRVIKTQIRNFIDGDFFFIDTDTVICHSLEEIDKFTDDIMMVPDGHLTKKEYCYGGSQQVEILFGEGIDGGDYFFNSGAIFVKDNGNTRKFFADWYKNWEISRNRGRNADQPSLWLTNKQYGYPIKPLPDKYNCQLGMSMKYLHEAYIVHSIHMNFIEDQSFSPFLGGTIYRELKKTGEITPEIADTILNCKSAWHTRCQVVGPDQIDFLWSPAGQAFSRAMMRSKGWTKFLNWCGMKLIKYERGKKKLKKIFKLH